MSEYMTYSESADGTMILKNGNFFMDGITFDLKKNRELIDLLNSSERDRKANGIFGQQERLNDLERRIAKLEPVVENYERRMFFMERIVEDNLDIFKNTNNL